MSRAMTFDELYRDVPAERREQVRAFRAAHPYKHLTVGNVKWEYLASGQGAETLLILGGGMSVGWSASEMITKYEGEYRVLAPSYPTVRKMDVVCDGLAAILDAEGIERAHVYGHSLGSGVGHALVRRHPERIDKLVLGSFGLYNERMLRKARRASWLYPLLPYGAVRRVYLPRIRAMTAELGPAEQAFQVARFEELLAMFHTKQSVLGQLAMLNDLFDHADAYGTFRPVERPGRVLILMADDDKGFEPSEQEALIAAYPGAQVHRFASGGHWVGATHREEYDAAMRDFLKKA